jgi:hypothetical protein
MMAAARRIASRGRKVSAKDRLFVQLLADAGFRDPNSAALAAGFREPYIGEKLISRLHDLIEPERLRRQGHTQMELPEALETLGKIARDESDRRTQHAALRTILEVQGVLSARQAAPRDRASIVRDIEDIVARINQGQAVGPTNRRVRVRFKAAVAIDAESAPETTAGSDALPDR